MAAVVSSSSDGAVVTAIAVDDEAMSNEVAVGEICNPRARLHAPPIVLTEEMRQRIETNRQRALELKKNRDVSEMEVVAATPEEIEAAAAVAIARPSSQSASAQPKTAAPARPCFENEDDPFGVGFGKDDDEGFIPSQPEPPASANVGEIVCDVAANEGATSIGLAEREAALVPAVSSECASEVFAASPMVGSSEASGASAVAVITTSSISKTDEDREEFTGLRLSRRERGISAELVREKFKTLGARVVPLSRTTEFSVVGTRRAQRNLVFVAVLYEKLKTDIRGNGEHYMTWAFTDLAVPTARRVMLNLRWQAFCHWRGKEAAKQASRGSVFAVMNPHLDADGALRVEKATQLTKLGDCASLGLCQMQRCQEPVNMDHGDRFCAVHLSRAFAEKCGRSAVNGGASIQGLIGVAGANRSDRPAPRQLKRPIEVEKSTDKDVVRNPAEDKQRARIDWTNYRNNRSFLSSDANKSYVRSIASGSTFSEQSEWSRVPVVGRGLEDRGEEQCALDLDLATLETSETQKAARILRGRAERAERELELQTEPTIAQSSNVSLALPGVDAPPAVDCRRQHRTSKASQPDCDYEWSVGSNRDATASSSKGSADQRRPQADQRPPMAPRRALPEKKRELGELLQALDTRRTARRASDNGAATARASPVSAKSVSPHACQDNVIESAQTFCNDLIAARTGGGSGQGLERVNAMLASVNELPAAVWVEDVGRRIYNEAGWWAKNGNEEIKRVAFSIRRRSRAATSTVAATSLAISTGTTTAARNVELVPSEVENIAVSAKEPACTSTKETENSQIFGPPGGDGGA